MKQHGAISRRTLNEDYFNGLRYLASVLITSALLLIGTVGGFFLLPFLMTAVVMAFLPFFALVVCDHLGMIVVVLNQEDIERLRHLEPPFRGERVEGAVVVLAPASC